MKKVQIKRQNPETKVVKPVRWRPSSRMGGFNAPEGYRTRWCEDTPENIAKKESEGWVLLDKTKFPNLSGTTNYEKQVTDSEGLSRTYLKRNELVAMVLPEEIARERDEYYRQETENRTQQALTSSEVRKLLSSKDPRGARNVVSLNPKSYSTIE